MKTKDLIAELQRIDPTGEGEVCVDNRDIYSVSREPAYWDGRLQRLILDESKKPYWHIAGARFVSEGDKVRINCPSVWELIVDDPDLPVEFGQGTNGYPEMVERCREIGRALDRGELPKDDWHSELADMVSEHGLGRVVKMLDQIAGEQYRRMTS